MSFCETIYGEMVKLMTLSAGDHLLKMLVLASYALFCQVSLVMVFEEGFLKPGRIVGCHQWAWAKHWNNPSEPYRHKPLARPRPRFGPLVMFSSQ